MFFLTVFDSPRTFGRLHGSPRLHGVSVCHRVTRTSSSDLPFTWECSTGLSKTTGMVLELQKEADLQESPLSPQGQRVRLVVAPTKTTLGWFPMGIFGWISFGFHVSKQEPLGESLPHGDGPLCGHPVLPAWNRVRVGLRGSGQRGLCFFPLENTPPKTINQETPMSWRVITMGSSCWIAIDTAGQ